MQGPIRTGPYQLGLPTSRSPTKRISSAPLDTASRMRSTNWVSQHRLVLVSPNVRDRIRGIHRSSLIGDLIEIAAAAAELCRRRVLTSGTTQERPYLLAARPHCTS